MNALLEACGPAAARWLPVLGRAAWQGALAIGLVALVVRLPLRLPAWTRVALWRVAYLKVLLSVVAVGTIALPILSTRPRPGSSATPAAAGASLPAERGESASGAARATPGRPSVTSAPPGQTAGPAAPRRSTWLFLAWLVGMQACLLRIGRHLGVAEQLRRSGAPYDDPWLTAQIAGLASEQGLAVAPPVRVTDGTAVPLLVGLRRPTIILPASLVLGCTRAELRLMVAHELVHLRRRDLLWNWLPELVEMLLFFHPLVWLARRERRLEEEMACDDQAYRLAGERPAHYAAMLVRVASLRARPHSYVVAAVAAVDSAAALRRRLAAMLHGRAAEGSARGRLAVTAVVLALLPWRVAAQAPPIPAATPQGEPAPLLLNAVLTVDGQQLPNPVHGTVESYAAGVLTVKPAAKDAAPGSRVIPVGTGAACWSLRKAELKDFTAGRWILVSGVEPGKLAQDSAKAVLIAPLEASTPIQGVMPRGMMIGALVQRAAPEEISAVAGGPVLWAGMPAPETPLTIRITPATALWLAERSAIESLVPGRLVHIDREPLTGKHTIVQLPEGAESPPDGPANASWRPLWVDGLVTATTPGEMTLLRCDATGEASGPAVVRLPLDVPAPCHVSLTEGAVKPGVGDQVLAFGERVADRGKLVASTVVVQPKPAGDEPLPAARLGLMMNLLRILPGSPSAVLIGPVLGLEPLVVQPQVLTGPRSAGQGGVELEFAPDCTRYALKWETAPRFTTGSRVVFCEYPVFGADQRVTIASDFVQVVTTPVDSSVDERGRLVVDGKRSFALGICALPWDDIDWAEAREAGFRVAVIGFHGRSLQHILGELDRARQAGVQVIVDTSFIHDKSPQLPPNIGPWTAVGDMLDGQLAVLHRHPAVIGWGIWEIDWRGDDRPREWGERYAQFQRADPDHFCVAKIDPFRSTNAGVAVDRCDLALSFFGDPDAHKCVQGAPRVMQDVVTQLQPAAPAMPAWAVIQASDIGLWEPAKHPDSRGPTLEEMRSAAFSSLATGGSGLLFYDWAHLKVDRRGFHTRLAEVQQVVSEIRALEPFLVSDEPPPPNQLTSNQVGMLYVRGWQNKGETLVIATNPSDTVTGSLNWALPAGAADPQVVAGEASEVSADGIKLLPLQAVAVKLRLR